MIIEKNKVVSLNYHLTVKEDGDTKETSVEKTDAAHPFVFLFGSGGVLEAFENNLKGKKQEILLIFCFQQKMVTEYGRKAAWSTFLKRRLKIAMAP